MALDLDNKKDARHVAKIKKWLAKVVEKNDRGGEKCSASIDAGDDLTVFDANDSCKLNSQIISALRSFAREYACAGRRNVPRQIVRRSRNLQQNFERRKACDTTPETTEPPTTEPQTTEPSSCDTPTEPTHPPTTEAPTTEPTNPCIKHTVYHKSAEKMTFTEGENYCKERGMVMATSPDGDQLHCGWWQVSLFFLGLIKIFSRESPTTLK